MTLFDLFALAVIGFSAAIGWHRGGIRELVTLLAIGAGFLAIALFGGPVSDGAPGTFGKLLALVLVFLAGDLAVSIPGAILVRRFVGAHKNRGDRAAGGAFGLLRGWVLAAFAAFTVEVYHVDTDLPPTLANGALGGPLLSTAHVLLRKADMSVTELSERPNRHI